MSELPLSSRLPLRGIVITAVLIFTVMLMGLISVLSPDEIVQFAHLTENNWLPFFIFRMTFYTIALGEFYRRIYANKDKKPNRRRIENQKIRLVFSVIILYELLFASGLIANLSGGG